MHSASDNGFVYQDAYQPARRRSGGCVALFTTVFNDTTTAENQLDTIRQRAQNQIQHSPPTFKAGKTTTEHKMKLADKLRSIWKDEDIWSKDYDNMCMQCVEHAVLCLHAATPHFESYIDSPKSALLILTRQLMHEQIYYLTDGSWIFFKTDTEIYTCTHIEDQGLKLSEVWLDDSAPSMIIVKHLPKYKQQRSNK